MSFPIKYDSGARLESFAKGVRTSRHFAEDMGEVYDGKSIAEPWDESLTIEAQDREVARGWMERESVKLQQFMDNYQTADKLIVLCRRFAFPEDNNVRFVESADSRQMSVKNLFFQLELEEDRLHEVYGFGNLAEMYPGCGHDKRYKTVGYSGRFTENGKQNLADILQKEITFYRQPESDPIGVNPETFRPSE